MTNLDPAPWKSASDEAKKSLILDAALRVFGTRGLDPPSMDDVAAEAGYVRRSLYRHFPTKAHLLAALAQRCLDHLILSLGDVEVTPLLDLARAYGRFGQGHPLEFQVILDVRGRTAVELWGDQGVPVVDCLVSGLASRLGPQGGERLAAALGYIEFQFRYRAVWNASGLAGSADDQDRILELLISKENV